MAIVIINPNSTETMTGAMTEIARQAVPDLRFEGWTSHRGPAAIQGVGDGADATPPLLELVRKADRQGADGIIIGCFDDTALNEAAAIATCPVVGIGQTAYHLAALRNWRFSVVTTMPVSVPIIEANIGALGLGGFLGKVRASNVPVLEIENDPDTSEQLILSEARRAEEEDGIDAVILGCAGMANISKTVGQSLNRVVLDPVVVAASCMKWLC
ncbi:MAG: aspartate/glutamate racemase family protein [Pseudomonadota bacterium]